MRIAADKRRGTRPQTIRYTPDTTWASTIPARPKPAKRTVQRKTAPMNYRSAKVAPVASRSGKGLAASDKLIIIIALMLAVCVCRDHIMPMIRDLIGSDAVQSVSVGSMSPFHQEHIREFALEKNAKSVFFRYTETGNIRLCSSRIPDSPPPDARWIRITGL